MKKIRKKLKILELTNYSVGGCGVWQRVKQESQELSKKGYIVKVFSSDLEKGTDKRVCKEEIINTIKVIRFPAKKLGGESFMSWFDKRTQEKALEYAPDIIIAHSYRHPHTLQALKIAGKLRKQGKKCRVFLVTHAPFERSSTRTFFHSLIVLLYDFFIGRFTLKRFDKIITISRWEEDYLYRLGIGQDSISYVPNGIPESFFNLKPLSMEENKILFLGRVSPIKNLETVIRAFPLLKDNSITFDITGPQEENYALKLTKLINSLNLNKRIFFSPPIFDLKEKIKKIDSCKLFILPSKSEGLPQSLIEAMAREKIVITSDNRAGKELLLDKKNGFLFKIGEEKELAEVINKIKYNNLYSIKKQAKKRVEMFRWKNVINNMTNLF